MSASSEFPMFIQVQNKRPKCSVTLGREVLGTLGTHFSIFSGYRGMNIDQYIKDFSGPVPNVPDPRAEQLITGGIPIREGCNHYQATTEDTPDTGQNTCRKNELKRK